MEFISVIIPIYKGERYIDGLIQMFDKAAQILMAVYLDVHVQLSFINDSPEVVLSASDHTDSVYVKCVYINPGIHQGIHGTRIYGVRHTESDYVLFFDQDDLIEERYLLSQYDKVNANGVAYDGVVCNGFCRGNRLIYSDSRPMNMTFDRKMLLEKKWNPLSPGQVLLRRSSIPLEQWGRYILKHNLTDDWLLWFLMTNKGCHFNTNNEVLYIHYEDGTNASQNWKGMRQSRVELLEIMRKQDVLTSAELDAFERRTKSFLDKYDEYIKFDGFLENIERSRLVEGIKRKTVGKSVAIYGMGVYGQKLLRLFSDANVVVSYEIDQLASSVQNSEIPIYGADRKNYPDVDVIVVTPLFAFDKIKETTLKGIEGTAVRMDDFLMDCADIANEDKNNEQRGLI